MFDDGALRHGQIVIYPFWPEPDGRSEAREPAVFRNRAHYFIALTYSTIHQRNQINSVRPLVNVGEYCNFDCGAVPKLPFLRRLLLTVYTRAYSGERP